MTSRARGPRPFPSAARKPSASIASPRRTPTSPPGPRRTAPGNMSARSWRRARRVPKTISRCARRTGRPPSCASPSARSSRTRARRWWRRGSRSRPPCAPVTSWRRPRARCTRGRCRNIRCRRSRMPVRSPCPCRSWPSMPANGALRAAARRGRALAVGGAGRGRRRAGFRAGALAATAPRRLAAARGARLATLPAGGDDRALQRDLGPPPRRLVLRRGLSPA